jgi:CofH/MqnC C-terminal region
VSDLSSWMQADILSLGMAADEARRARGGSVATYLRVHMLTAADAVAGTPVPREASEVRLTELPDSLEAALQHVVSARRLAGTRSVAAYSMADLEDRAGNGWGSLTDILGQLVAAGMNDVAELPVDRVTDPARALSLLEEAGARPRRLTLHAPAGDQKLEILNRLRACALVAKGPLYCAPLPKVAPIDKPTTGYEDLRMVALTRLVLADGAATQSLHVEVDWQLYGPKLAQVALTFGADHLDAVAATSDPALGPRRQSAADVERNIRAAGFEPQELRLSA